MGGIPFFGYWDIYIYQTKLSSYLGVGASQATCKCKTTSRRQQVGDDNRGASWWETPNQRGEKTIDILNS